MEVNNGTTPLLTIMAHPEGESLGLRHWALSYCERQLAIMERLIMAGANVHAEDKVR